MQEILISLLYPPFPLNEYNSALEKHPNLFLASSSLEIAQKALAKKISELIMIINMATYTQLCISLC